MTLKSLDVQTSEHDLLSLRHSYFEYIYVSSLRARQQTTRDIGKCIRLQRDFVMARPHMTMEKSVSTICYLLDFEKNYQLTLVHHVIIHHVQGWQE